jgi:hypothetical protein
MIVSILFLFILGVFEFGRLFFAFGTMSHGVREAARYAVVNPGASDVAQRAEDSIFLIGGSADVQVFYYPHESDPSDPYCSHLCKVEVKATSTYRPWTPLVPSFEMEAQATLHIE